MKNKLKKALVLGLTFVMTLSMAACGKKDGDGGNGGGGLFGGGSKNDTVAASSSLAKENVYRVDEVKLSNVPKDVNIMTTVIKDNKLLLLLSKYEYNEETYESSEKIFLYTCNMDGSNPVTTELEMPELVMSENAEDPAFDAYNTSDYYGNYMLATNGKIYAVKNHYDNWSSEDNWKSETRYYICVWDADGKLLEDVLMEGVESTENNWCYVDNLFESENGVSALVRGEENYLYRVDGDGNKLDSKKLSDDVNDAFSNSEKTITLQNGNIFLIYHDAENYEKTYYGELDTKTMTLSAKKEFPSNVMSLWNYSIMTAGQNNDLLFTSSNGLYRYKIGDSEPVKMMDYINSDFFVSDFMNLSPISEDSFFGIYRENWDDEGMRAGTFTYVKPEDIQDKVVLVLAGEWIGYDVKKRVVDFNKSSQTTKIVVKDYSEYNTYEDYTAGVTKLNNDIITGSMPDILCVNEYDGLQVENYIAKGLIADIGKMIKEDPELSQVEFMTNVFDAYSVDGVLYYVVPGFEVYSMAAKTKLVGDRSSWTMKDMQEVVAKMGPDATAFGTEMTRSNFMNMVLRFCGSQFVDFGTGECKFNSQDFIDMLEYAKNFPAEINYDDDYWMNYDWAAEQAKYREEKTLLYSANFYNFQYFAEIFNGYFGEPISFVGFPTESGKGSYIMSSGTYVMSSKSANKKEAWDFLRYYLTDEYQKEVSYFPVRKELFLEKSKEALNRPFWTDEDGNIEYYDNTFYLNGEEIILDPLNQQQLDQTIDFISSVNNKYYSNEEIQKIIEEEAEAFFQNQKSASDVAAIIQSRIQLYVDETR